MSSSRALAHLLVQGPPPSVLVARIVVIGEVHSAMAVFATRNARSAPWVWFRAMIGHPVHDDERRLSPEAALACLARKG